MQTRGHQAALVQERLKLRLALDQALATGSARVTLTEGNILATYWSLENTTDLTDAAASTFSTIRNSLR